MTTGITTGVSNSAASKATITAKNENNSLTKPLNSPKINPNTIGTNMMKSKKYS